MKNILSFIFVVFICTNILSQTIVFDFNFYSEFKFTGDVVDTNILKHDKFQYTKIGFGKNHVTIDTKSKTFTNDYYVNEDFNGKLVYTNMTNYKKTNGVIKFQAQRIDFETNQPYTEYFIINENSEINSPYIISYWYVGDVINGVVVPKSAVKIN